MRRLTIEVAERTKQAPIRAAVDMPKVLRAIVMGSDVEDNLIKAVQGFSESELLAIILQNDVASVRNRLEEEVYDGPLLDEEVVDGFRRKLKKIFDLRGGESASTSKESDKCAAKADRCVLDVVLSQLLADGENVLHRALAQSPLFSASRAGSFGKRRRKSKKNLAFMNDLYQNGLNAFDESLAQLLSQSNFSQSLIGFLIATKSVVCMVSFLGRNEGVLPPAARCDESLQNQVLVTLEGMTKQKLPDPLEALKAAENSIARTTSLKLGGMKEGGDGPDKSFQDDDADADDEEDSMSHNLLQYGVVSDEQAGVTLAVICGVNVELVQDSLLVRIPSHFNLAWNQDPKVVSDNFRCDAKGCENPQPLIGQRFRCTCCENFDLCYSCYLKHESHDEDHPFFVYANSKSKDFLLPSRISTKYSRVGVPCVNVPSSDASICYFEVKVPRKLHETLRVGWMLHQVHGSDENVSGGAGTWTCICSSVNKGSAPICNVCGTLRMCEPIATNSRDEQSPLLGEDAFSWGFSPQTASFFHCSVSEPLSSEQKKGDENVTIGAWFNPSTKTFGFSIGEKKFESNARRVPDSATLFPCVSFLVMESETFERLHFNAGQHEFDCWRPEGARTLLDYSMSSCVEIPADDVEAGALLEEPHGYQRFMEPGNVYRLEALIFWDPEEVGTSESATKLFTIMCRCSQSLCVAFGIAGDGHLCLNDELNRCNSWSRWAVVIPRRWQHVCVTLIGTKTRVVSVVFAVDGRNVKSEIKGTRDRRIPASSRFGLHGSLADRERHRSKDRSRRETYGRAAWAFGAKIRPRTDKSNNWSLSNQFTGRLVEVRAWGSPSRDEDLPEIAMGRVTSIERQWWRKLLLRLRFDEAGGQVAYLSSEGQMPIQIPCVLLGRSSFKTVRSSVIKQAKPPEGLPHIFPKPEDSLADLLHAAEDDASEVAVRYSTWLSRILSGILRLLEACKRLQSLEMAWGFEVESPQMAVQPHVLTFLLLHSIIRQVSGQEFLRQSNVLRACLRILRENIRQVIHSGRDPSSVGLGATGMASGQFETKESNMVTLRRLLLLQLDMSDLQNQHVRSEAAACLAVGRDIFYRDDTEQRQLLIDLLRIDNSTAQEEDALIPTSRSGRHVLFAALVEALLTENRETCSKLLLGEKHLFEEECSDEGDGEDEVGLRRGGDQDGHEETKAGSEMKLRWTPAFVAASLSGRQSNAPDTAVAAAANINAAGGEVLTKRTVIRYMQEVSPREFLETRNLHRNEMVVTKTSTSTFIIEAYSELESLRSSGDVAIDEAAEESTATKSDMPAIDSGTKLDTQGADGAFLVRVLIQHILETRISQVEPAIKLLTRLYQCLLDECVVSPRHSRKYPDPWSLFLQHYLRRRLPLEERRDATNLDSTDWFERIGNPLAEYLAPLPVPNDSSPSTQSREREAPHFDVNLSYERLKFSEGNTMCERTHSSHKLKWCTAFGSQAFTKGTGIHRWIIKVKRCSSEGTLLVGLASEKASKERFLGADSRSLGISRAGEVYFGSVPVQAGMLPRKLLNEGSRIMFEFDSHNMILSVGELIDSESMEPAKWNSLRVPDELYDEEGSSLRPAVALKTNGDCVGLAYADPIPSVSRRRVRACSDEDWWKGFLESNRKSKGANSLLTSVVGGVIEVVNGHKVRNVRQLEAVFKPVLALVLLSPSSDARFASSVVNNLDSVFRKHRDRFSKEMIMLFGLTSSKVTAMLLNARIEEAIDLDEYSADAIRNASVWAESDLFANGFIDLREKAAAAIGFGKDDGGNPEVLLGEVPALRDFVLDTPLSKLFHSWIEGHLNVHLLRLGLSGKQHEMRPGVNALVASFLQHSGFLPVVLKMMRDVDGLRSKLSLSKLSEALASCRPHQSLLSIWRSALKAASTLLHEVSEEFVMSYLMRIARFLFCIHGAHVLPENQVLAIVNRFRAEIGLADVQSNNKSRFPAADRLISTHSDPLEFDDSASLTSSRSTSAGLPLRPTSSMLTRSRSIGPRQLSIGGLLRSKPSLFDFLNCSGESGSSGELRKEQLDLILHQLKNFVVETGQQKVSVSLLHIVIQGRRRVANWKLLGLQKHTAGLHGVPLSKESLTYHCALLCMVPIALRGSNENLSHYLEGLHSCGKELQDSLSSAVEKLLSSTTELLRASMVLNEESTLGFKLLALDLLCCRVHPEDHRSLSRGRVFETLQDMLHSSSEESGSEQMTNRGQDLLRETAMKIFYLLCFQVAMADKNILRNKTPLDGAVFNLLYKETRSACDQHLASSKDIGAENHLHELLTLLVAVCEVRSSRALLMSTPWVYLFSEIATKCEATLLTKAFVLLRRIMQDYKGRSPSDALETMAWFLKFAVGCVCQALLPCPDEKAPSSPHIAMQVACEAAHTIRSLVQVETWRTLTKHAMDSYSEDEVIALIAALSGSFAIFEKGAPVMVWGFDASEPFSSSPAYLCSSLEEVSSSTTAEVSFVASIGKVSKVPTMQLFPQQDLESLPDVDITSIAKIHARSRSNLISPTDKLGAKRFSFSEHCGETISIYDSPGGDSCGELGKNEQILSIKREGEWLELEDGGRWVQAQNSSDDYILVPVLEGIEEIARAENELRWRLAECFSLKFLSDWTAKQAIWESSVLKAFGGDFISYLHANASHNTPGYTAASLPALHERLCIVLEELIGKGAAVQEGTEEGNLVDQVKAMQKEAEDGDDILAAVPPPRSTSRMSSQSGGSHSTSGERRNFIRDSDISAFSGEIEQIMDMGFPRRWAEFAIKRNDGDVAAAISYICSNGDSIDDKIAMAASMDASTSSSSLKRVLSMTGDATNLPPKSTSRASSSCSSVDAKDLMEANIQGQRNELDSFTDNRDPVLMATYRLPGEARNSRARMDEILHEAAKMHWGPCADSRKSYRDLLESYSREELLEEAHHVATSIVALWSSVILLQAMSRAVDGGALVEKALSIAQPEHQFVDLIARVSFERVPFFGRETLQQITAQKDCFALFEAISSFVSVSLQRNEEVVRALFEKVKLILESQERVDLPVSHLLFFAKWASELLLASPSWREKDDLKLFKAWKLVLRSPRQSVKLVAFDVINMMLELAKSDEDHLRRCLVALPVQRLQSLSARMFRDEMDQDEGPSRYVKALTQLTANIMGFLRSLGLKPEAAELRLEEEDCLVLQDSNGKRIKSIGAPWSVVMRSKFLSGSSGVLLSDSGPKSSAMSMQLFTKSADTGSGTQLLYVKLGEYICPTGLHLPESQYLDIAVTCAPLYLAPALKTHFKPRGSEKPSATSGNVDQKEVDEDPKNDAEVMDNEDCDDVDETEEEEDDDDDDDEEGDDDDDDDGDDEEEDEDDEGNANGESALQLLHGEVSTDFQTYAHAFSESDPSRRGAGFELKFFLNGKLRATLATFNEIRLTLREIGSLSEPSFSGSVQYLGVWRHAFSIEDMQRLQHYARLAAGNLCLSETFRRPEILHSWWAFTIFPGQDVSMIAEADVGDGIGILQGPNATICSIGETVPNDSVLLKDSDEKNMSFQGVLHWEFDSMLAARENLFGIPREFKNAFVPLEVRFVHDSWKLYLNEGDGDAVVCNLSLDGSDLVVVDVELGSTDSRRWLRSLRLSVNANMFPAEAITVDGQWSTEVALARIFTNDLFAERSSVEDRLRFVGDLCPGLVDLHDQGTSIALGCDFVKFSSFLPPFVLHQRLEIAEWIVILLETRDRPYVPLISDLMAQDGRGDVESGTNAGEQPAAAMPGTWPCPACTFINEIDNNSCAICATANPKPMTADAGTIKGVYMDGEGIIFPNSGVFHWEFLVSWDDDSSEDFERGSVGLCRRGASLRHRLGSTADSWGLSFDGQAWWNGEACRFIKGGERIHSGDIIGLELNTFELSIRVFVNRCLRGVSEQVEFLRECNVSPCAALFSLQSSRIACLGFKNGVCQTLATGSEVETVATWENGLLEGPALLISKDQESCGHFKKGRRASWWQHGEETVFYDKGVAGRDNSKPPKPEHFSLLKEDLRATLSRVESESQTKSDETSMELFTTVLFDGRFTLSQRQMVLLDPFSAGPEISVSQDCLTAEYHANRVGGDSSRRAHVLGSKGFRSGIHYWEVHVKGMQWGSTYIGVAVPPPMHQQIAVRDRGREWASGYGFVNYRATHGPEGEQLYGSFYSAGDVVGVLLDLNRGRLYFFKDFKDYQNEEKQTFINLGPAYCGIRSKYMSKRGERTDPLFFPCFGLSRGSDKLTLSNMRSLHGEDKSSHQILSELSHSSLLIREILHNRASQHFVKSALKLWRSPFQGAIQMKRWQKSIGGIRVLLDVSCDPSSLVEEFPSGCGPGAVLQSNRGEITIQGISQGLIWFLLDDDGTLLFWTPGELEGLLKDEKLSVIHPAPIRSHPSDKWPHQVEVTEEDFLANDEEWDLERASAMVRVVNELCNDLRRHPLQIHWNMVLQKLREARMERFGPQDFNKFSDAFLVAQFLKLLVLNECVEQILPSLNLGRVGHTRASRLVVALKHFNRDYPRNIVDIEHLVESSRDLIFSRVKLEFWSKLLEWTTTPTIPAADEYEHPPDFPTIEINRVRAGEHHLLNMNPNQRLRSSVFGQMMVKVGMESWPNRKLRRSYTHIQDASQRRCFFVKFESEGVDDHGGPYRAVFQIAIEEEAQGPLEILIPTPNAEDGAMQHADKVIFNAFEEDTDMCNNEAGSSALASSMSSRLKASQARRRHAWARGALRSNYRWPTSAAGSSRCARFLGRLVGIAVRHDIHLGLSLPGLIWKPLVCMPVGWEDLHEVDTYTTRSLRQIEMLPQEEWDAAIESWSEMLLERLSEDQLPEVTRGSLVIPYELRSTAVRFIAEAYLSRSSALLDAFAAGLEEILPMSCCWLFTPEELELLFCGGPEISVDLLKQATMYEDVNPDDPHVRHFWAALEKMTQDQRSKFINFVWARSRLPPSVDKFPMKFKIMPFIRDEDESNNNDDQVSTQPDEDKFLPHSQTCFFSLSLPKYSSPEICLKKLLYAAENCNTMEDFNQEDAGGFRGLM